MPGVHEARMAKLKRKTKTSRVPKAKKKAHKNKVLKKKSAPKARPAAKKVKAPKKPLKKVIAKKVVAPVKAPAGKVAGKPEDKKGKLAGKPLGKPGIKSAKAALELLEANVAAAKGKGVKGRPGRKGKKDAWLIPPELPKEDAETRRTRLKNLIKLGKDRGFLTYSEINDHLPDDDVEEQAEAALSTVDSEFGRTTDPVRMYMREMGSVELLTREGEIEIAKRIEDGLRHMIQAISACPT